MSKTNENILKSLAVLEQNLQDINSAKEQVNNVVKSSGNLANVIESYQTSFESLSINVKAVLEDSKKFNSDSVKKLSEQTKDFSKEVAKLKEFDISKALKSIETETINQFQQNLSKPLSDLDQQIKNIDKEVARLTEYDFKDLFSNLEKQVVNHFKIDLKEKLDAFDNKSRDLQSKIDQFKAQILRIEKVDLESHFNNILTVLKNQSDKKNIELSKKYDKVINKTDKIILHLTKQEKETKILKTLLIATISIIIIGIVITSVMK